ncbi:hypothetical protein DOY81_009786 [Sarcophaga bullata]|nr:hypothetical protein DOY81_009786 [Sarcophaga bullata]
MYICKMLRNKMSMSSTGGGVSQYCPLSSMEEQVINLLRMEEAVNGLATVTCFGTSSAIRDDSAIKESAEVFLSSQNEVINESPHAAKRSSLDESFQTSKRSRLSHHDRDNLLKTQVENHEISHKETTKLLGDVYRIH